MALSDDLQAAAAGGIITGPQATQLAAFLAQRGGSTSSDAGIMAEHAPTGEERFRLIGGFNDIFVGIGIAFVYDACAG